MPLFDAKNKSQARIIQFSSVCSHPLQLETLQRELSIERNSHPQECRSRSILTTPSLGKRPGGDLGVAEFIAARFVSGYLIQLKPDLQALDHSDNRRKARNRK